MNTGQYTNYLVDLDRVRDLTAPRPESHPTLLQRVPAIHRYDADSSLDILAGLRPQILILNNTLDIFYSVF